MLAMSQWCLPGTDISGTDAPPNSHHDVLLIGLPALEPPTSDPESSRIASNRQDSCCNYKTISAPGPRRFAGVPPSWGVHFLGAFTDFQGHRYEVNDLTSSLPAALIEGIFRPA